MLYSTFIDRFRVSAHILEVELYIYSLLKDQKGYAILYVIWIIWKMNMNLQSTHIMKYYLCRRYVFKPVQLLSVQNRNEMCSVRKYLFKSIRTLSIFVIVRRVFRTTWHLLRFCIRYVCTRAERRKTNRPYYIVLWYGMILHDMVCCIMLCYIPGFGFILVIFSWHNIVIHNIVAGGVSFRQVIHLCRERSVFWNIATILVLQFHIKRHIYRPLIVYENIKAVYISDRFYDI